MTTIDANHRIVVGIDGSPAAEQALQWAGQEARMRHAVLEIDHVWSLPNLGYAGFVTQIDDFEKDAQELLDKVVGQAREAFPDLQIEANLLEGPPAPALIARGKLADLLIVGSRGHGGFAGLMLGSVSNQIVHHASFPVVVVHSSRH